jgi:hypothetical protein
MEIFTMNEIIFNIGIYLKLGEIYKLCSINKTYESVLGSNYFWKSKYIHDYGDNELKNWRKEYLNFKPERRRTPYVMYLLDSMQSIKNDNLGKSNRDICIIGAQEWKSLKPQMRDNYIKKADQDKIRYAQQMLIYTDNQESIGSKKEPQVS